MKFSSSIALPAAVIRYTLWLEGAGPDEFSGHFCVHVGDTYNPPAFRNRSILNRPVFFWDDQDLNRKPGGLLPALGSTSDAQNRSSANGMYHR